MLIQNLSRGSVLWQLGFLFASFFNRLHEQSISRQILLWPFRDHEQVMFLARQFLPNGLGDEWHKGVKELERDDEHFIERSGATRLCLRLTAFENDLRFLYDFSRKTVPHEMVELLCGYVHAVCFDIFGDFGRDRLCLIDERLVDGKK